MITFITPKTFFILKKKNLAVECISVIIVKRVMFMGLL